MKSTTLRYLQYVQRITMFFASVVIIGSACAQSDTSLTKEFADLNAKERNRIAKKEQIEAESDVAYQAIMTTAEALFREKRFEASLDQYTIARNMRPYNVFPKVKIQDLNALIQLRAEQQLELTRSNNGITIEKVERPVEPVSMEEVPPTALEIPEEPPTKQAFIAENPPSTVKVSNNVPDQQRSSKAPLEDKLATPSNENTKMPSTDGVVERYSKEGRALICEREVTSEGKKCVYRRVVHPWGEIMYFRDGVSVPERAWVEAFGD